MVVVVAFSLLVKIWGNVWPFIPCPHFIYLFVFIEVEISLHTLIPLCMPGSVHNGSAGWDDCGRMFPDKMPVSSFTNRFSHCLDSSIISPLLLCWIKGVCMFRCNLPLVLLAQWPGSFMCYCGNTGVDRALNKSQHTELTLEKNIFLLLPLGFELTTFWSWAWCSYQQAIPAPT